MFLLRISWSAAAPMLRNPLADWCQRGQRLIWKGWVYMQGSKSCVQLYGPSNKYVCWAVLGGVAIPSGWWRYSSTVFSCFPSDVSFGKVCVTLGWQKLPRGFRAAWWTLLFLKVCNCSKFFFVKARGMIRSAHFRRHRPDQGSIGWLKNTQWWEGVPRSPPLRPILRGVNGPPCFSYLWTQKRPKNPQKSKNPGASGHETGNCISFVNFSTNDLVLFWHG